MVASDLSLHGLHMSNKKDVRLIWVDMRDFRLRDRWFESHSRHCSCYVVELLWNRPVKQTLQKQNIYNNDIRGHSHE